jgi:hypothetical protein
MKYVRVNFKFQKVFNAILLVLAFSSCSIQLIGQTNPWENQSKENPWETTKKEQPKISTSSIDSSEISTNSETPIVKVDSTLNGVNQLVNEADTSSNVIVTKTEKVDTEQIRIEKSNPLNLRELEYITKKNYVPPVAFVGSFLTGGVFLILALPVNMIFSVIPTPRSKSYVANYITEHPKASKSEIKAVKKGIQKKRSLKSLGGSLAGIGAGITVWIAIALSNL